jgi:rfaE bifunctional protein kinase chain/domain
MITKEELLRVRAKAKSLKAMVIGDVMLDRYIYGSVDRISPEAPVPILSHQSSEVKAGGAANVALNLASWGCKTYLAGLVGKDNNAGVLRVLLEQNHIMSHLVESKDRPTTIKTRVVASSHHLLRIDEESTKYLNGTEEDNSIRDIMIFLEKVKPDLVILQDYNKGLLTENLIREITGFCNTHSIYLSIDPKELNFLHYHDANLFKPNLREAGAAAKRALGVSDLTDLAKAWRSKMKIGTIAVTLGSQGIFLQDSDHEYHVSPGHSVDVVDVCGAGDAVICSLSLGLMSGLDLQKSGDLANLTGAYVCSHSGVVATNPDDIINWLSL